MNNKPKILLVEDDPNLGGLLKEFLEVKDFEVSLAVDGEKGLEQFQNFEFDLLILDESLANVDEKLRQTIVLAIKDLFKDKMFLYISHNLMEVSKFCSQILVFGQSALANDSFMVTGQDCKSSHLLNKR